jgi:molybdopterin converting factor small subunit
MPTTVLIPTPLRGFTDKKASVVLDGETVGELLEQLASQYSGLRRHLFTDGGELRSFVNVYVNDEDIRSLQKNKTPVREDDVVSIIPAIAGGRF